MNEQDTTTKASNTVTGRVVGARADKTITVLLERRVQHPLYGKFVRRSTKVHAHDENNECKEGDTVVVQQCRPVSKTKTWRLVKVLEQAGA